MTGRWGRIAILLVVHLLIVLTAFTAGWFLGPGSAIPETAPLVALSRYRPLVYLVAEDYARSNDITLGRAVFGGWDYRLLSRELSLVAEQEEDEPTRERLIAFRDALSESRGDSPALFELGPELGQILQSLLRDRTLFWSVMVGAAFVIALFTTAVFFALRVLTRPPRTAPSKLMEPSLAGNGASAPGSAVIVAELSQGSPRPAEPDWIGETDTAEGLSDRMEFEGAGGVGIHEARPVLSDSRPPASPFEETGLPESRPLDAHTLVGELPEINIVEIAESSQWILARLREKNRDRWSNPA